MADQTAGNPAERLDTCPHCGSTLVSETSTEDVALEVRMPCTNPDCAGKWTATEFGGEEGLRQSYDVPGLSDGTTS